MAAVPTKERAPDLPVEPQDRKLMIVSGTLEGEAREHPVSEPLIGLNYHELAVGASRDDTLIRCCRLFGRRCSVTQERGLALIGCTKGPRAGVENQNWLIPSDADPARSWPERSELVMARTLRTRGW
jgi:hypothetical protein